MKIMPDKIASSVSYCVSGSLVCGGGVAQWLHSIDWNFVAILSGIVIGIATFFTNLHFNRKRTSAYLAALERGVITPPEDK